MTAPLTVCRAALHWLGILLGKLLWVKLPLWDDPCAIECMFIHGVMDLPLCHVLLSEPLISGPVVLTVPKHTSTHGEVWEVPIWLLLQQSAWFNS